MTRSDAVPPGTRRGFLGRLSALVSGTALGGALLARGLEAHEPQQPNGPLVHPEDAWLDTLPRGHRMVFDAFTLPGAVNAGRYCGNWLYSNGTGYGLKPEQLGAVIVLRSMATIYAFSDAMWAKYPVFGQQSKQTDATTNRPLEYNPFLRAPVAGGPTQGVQWSSLASQGVHFAVCNGTTTMLAGMIAGSDAKATETVRQELAAHLLPNGHLMATGIVALGRAQEKGYTFGCGG
jgi:hypothetical protein